MSERPSRDDPERPTIRFGFLYGIVVSALVLYGMLQFYLSHPGRFTLVEDYVQFGLATLLTLVFVILGTRYVILFLSDLRSRR
ncbi:MAG TPA: hypothetical protein VMS56_14910 [Thermoanaerobaculia bacterium]|nr:hypothetical protein [Thermoanaerobaculia bacterium]